ncbi:MAG TPA: hypothetical protein VF790_05175 [Dissulfurispiraceae bacterium]
MKKESKICDEDLANAEVALRRAAKKAKLIAEQTHTPLILFEDGHIVKKTVVKRRIKQGAAAVKNRINVRQ